MTSVNDKIHPRVLQSQYSLRPHPFQSDEGSGSVLQLLSCTERVKGPVAIIVRKCIYLNRNISRADHRAFKPGV